MPRNRLILAILILLVTFYGCAPEKTSPKKVLLILKEGSGDLDFMLTHEVEVMIDILQKAGYEVVTASATGQTLSGTTKSVTPDMKVVDVEMEEYAGIILPCLATGFSPAPLEVTGIIKKAANLKLPIAAQYSSIGYLYNAGVLDGKRFTMSTEAAPYAPKATWAGEGVVQDGNIITSSICPMRESGGEGMDGTPELTQKFIAAIQSNQ